MAKLIFKSGQMRSQALQTLIILSAIAALVGAIGPGRVQGIEAITRGVSFLSADRSFLITNQHAQASGRKRALLVGISRYRRPVKNGLPWPDLDTTNDLEAIASVLIARFKFSLDDITFISDLPLLVDGKVVAAVPPTHKTIVDSFRKHLIEQTRPQDIAFFYFAGHGCQIADDGTDELDGLDETLVPLDYVSREDGSRNIKDDEIGALLDELGQKDPANVTIAIDSCFSGTATRSSYDTPRGGECEGAKGLVADDDTFNDWSSLRDSSNRPRLRNYVFLAASSSRQLAVQTDFCTDKVCKTYGVFSHALASALNDAQTTTTYMDVYERVLNEVSRDRAQLPQIEGDLRDAILFRDGASPAENYIRVIVEKLKDKPVKSSDYNIILAAGALQGMTVGSTFALYPAGTKSREGAKPLGEARITAVEATIATLRVEGNINPISINSAARAFEISHNYERVLNVAVKDVESFPGIMPMLKTLNLATTVSEATGDWNLLIRAAVQADRDEHLVPADFKGVILQRRDGKAIVTTIEDSTDMSERIKYALITEAKRLTLLSLKDRNPKIKVEMRLVPMELEWHLDRFGHGKIDKIIGNKKEGLKYSTSGVIEFKLNDWYRLEVRNLSESDVYITILTLDAKGQISPMFPRYDRNNLLKPAGKLNDKNDGWVAIEDVYTRIIKPLGMESLHAIATMEQTDFSPLFDPGIIDRSRAVGRSFAQELLNEAEVIKGNNQRGGNKAAQKLETAMKSPLGQIFLAVQEGKRLRNGGASMPPPSWSTTSVSYLVVE